MNPIARLLSAAAALVAGLIVTAAGAAQDPKPAAPAAQPNGKNIDVVLCLDVSGSMQGLIEQAKNKLWDIVNELAKIKPSPNLRVGLYSYGHTTYDPNKGWVRKELDLSTELDQVYQKLFALTISGGDEYVARVSRDAVVEQKWCMDKDALRLIFVAGNEPASQDPLVTMKQAADIAKEKAIIINPIYCGGADDADGRSWRDLAALAGGRFANINQNQHVVVNTPQDKVLAELGVKLNETYVAYGAEMSKAKDQKEVTANSAKQGAGVVASRVISQNQAIYNCAAWDLVDRCKQDPKFDITKLKEEELCDSLKKMTVAERVKYVKDMTAKREGIQKEITTLETKRNEYIRAEMKRNPNPADRAFDAAIRETLRVQAGAKGMQIPE